jgi:hypothetical protein
MEEWALELCVLRDEFWCVKGKKWEEWWTKHSKWKNYSKAILNACFVSRKPEAHTLILATQEAEICIAAPTFSAVTIFKIP